MLAPVWSFCGFQQPACANVCVRRIRGSLYAEQTVQFNLGNFDLKLPPFWAARMLSFKYGIL